MPDLGKKMTPAQERKFLEDFEAGRTARNPNIPEPEPKVWGFNGLDLDPRSSRWEALVKALMRTGKPVR